jgi:hypothetical protein
MIHLENSDESQAYQEIEHNICIVERLLNTTGELERVKYLQLFKGLEVRELSSKNFQRTAFKYISLHACF